MADLKYYDIILKPVVTERTMEQMGERKYVFYVHPEATKNQIKEAVHKMFDGVEVVSVNTMNLNGKVKKRGTAVGKTSNRKKAIIKLTENSKEIEIFQGM